jgi:arabinan endo-1,5-alpha-L-arabinosidase
LTRQELEKKILNLQGDIVAHDPTAIKAGNTYYLFTTGKGIPIHCSPDLINWKTCGQVFDQNPEWVVNTIPGVKDLWAPDVAFFSGKYHLYYAASTFGNKHSAIGLVTNKTLDMQSPDYQWVDEGLVLESVPSGDFNAIDPNITFDGNGQPWLAFGSFWSGIKLRWLDLATGKLSSQDTRQFDIASRPLVPDRGAIEGAFILHRGNYYYLFVSFDFCCRGKDSTYKIMVGRSNQITGPYGDREGKPMMQGGGTLVLQGSERWRGPGHNSIHTEGDTHWLVYHAYDADYGGNPRLRIEALVWDDQQWPQSPSEMLNHP